MPLDVFGDLHALKNIYPPKSLYQSLNVVNDDVIFFLFSLTLSLFSVTLTLNEILTVTLNKTTTDACAYGPLIKHVWS